MRVNLDTWDNVASTSVLTISRENASPLLGFRVVGVGFRFVSCLLSLHLHDSVSSESPESWVILFFSYPRLCQGFIWWWSSHFSSCGQDTSLSRASWNVPSDALRERRCSVSKENTGAMKLQVTCGLLYILLKDILPSFKTSFSLFFSLSWTQN